MRHPVRAKQIIKSTKRDYVIDFMNSMFVFHFECDVPVVVVARAVVVPISGHMTRSAESAEFVYNV